MRSRNSISYNNLLVSRECNPVIHLENYTIVFFFLSCCFLCVTITALTLSSQAFSRIPLTVTGCRGVPGNMLRGETRPSEECHCYGRDQCTAFDSHCCVQPVERAIIIVSIFNTWCDSDGQNKIEEKMAVTILEVNRKKMEK